MECTAKQQHDWTSNDKLTH